MIEKHRIPPWENLPCLALLFSMMKVFNKKFFFAACLLLVTLYLSASLTRQAGAELVNIVIRNSSSALLVDIKLQDAFTDELKAALNKGIPTDIVFSVSLYEVRNFWFDQKEVGKTLIHQIRFDTVKKEFKIRRSWEKVGFRTAKDTGAAQRILSEIKGLKVIALKRLVKGSQYQLRIKSELKDRSYPFTGTPWEFETDWYTVNFVY